MNEVCKYVAHVRLHLLLVTYLESLLESETYVLTRDTLDHLPQSLPKTPIHTIHHSLVPAVRYTMNTPPLESDGSSSIDPHSPTLVGEVARLEASPLGQAN